MTDPKACKLFFSKKSSGSQQVTSTLGQCQSCERLQPDPGLLGGCLELAQTLPSVQIPHEPGTGPELTCGYLASRLDMACIYPALSMVYLYLSSWLPARISQQDLLHRSGHLFHISPWIRLCFSHLYGDQERRVPLLR